MLFEAGGSAAGDDAATSFRGGPGHPRAAQLCVREKLVGGRKPEGIGHVKGEDQGGGYPEML